MAYTRLTAGSYLAIYSETEMVEIKAKSLEEAKNIADWYQDGVKIVCKIPGVINYIGDLKIGYEPKGR